MQPKERIVIRALRAAFRIWPFMHGRGWILRAARLLLGSNPIRFDIGRGAFIDGTLDDWMILWTFMCRHEADAPFQRSLDLVQRDAVVLDVGANFGVWSLLASKRGANVHAFEPVPAMVSRLRDHIALNDANSIAVHTIALGENEGTAPFFAVTSRNTGASALVRRAEDDVELRVDVITLDHWIERENIDRVDLMKVDVEGAEILVFRGARRFLSSANAPIVFFEINEKLCASFGATTRDVKQLLVECGYGIYRWRRSKFESVSLEERHEHEDLFALKGRPS
ncbi:MAG TPA: FkbM family methyltransferase [Thermoanaerobaculia bacterium]|nr:FkbM family methyltransferase [Thermoanaerobaculia bacterium]